LQSGVFMKSLSLLNQLSDALATQVGAAQPLVVGIRNSARMHISGILWQRDIVVTSEQAMGDREEYEVIGATDPVKPGEVKVARIAGRDPATNLLALRLDRPDGETVAADTARAAARPGTLVFGVAATVDGAPAARLGTVHSVGPEWHSRLGGRIEQRIDLDIRLTRTEEGGPVLDTYGALLGMSTLGSRGQVLVIPAATIERVTPQLLTGGQVARGWLGLGMQPVAVPNPLRDAAAQASGMIVMSIAENSPAVEARVKAGDIVLSVDGTPIHGLRQLAPVLDTDSIGKSIALRVIRGGEIISLSLTIGVRPKS
jgi:S1-C subfamily serine protease